MAVWSSPPSCRHILKPEIIRTVAGLCKFKLHAVVIKCLTGDDSHAVVVFHINIFFINLRHMFYSESSLACGDCDCIYGREADCEA